MNFVVIDKFKLMVHLATPVLNKLHQLSLYIMQFIFL